MDPLPPGQNGNGCSPASTQLHGEDPLWGRMLVDPAVGIISKTLFPPFIHEDGIGVVLTTATI